MTMKMKDDRRKGMKKKGWTGRSLVAIIGVVFLLAVISGPVEAGQRPTALKFGVGLASVTAADIGSGFLYGGGVFTMLTEKIGMEVLLERYSVRSEKDIVGLGVGRIQTTPLLINVQYRFSEGKVIPYALLGVGFYFVHYWPDSGDGHGEEDLADRFALQFGGGVEYPLSSNFALFSDARFSYIRTWVQPRGEIFVNPDDKDKVSLHALNFSFGVKYYF
jgi:opacity protein-like surface antigen